MPSPVLLIAAHGTRDPDGARATAEFADAVRASRPSADVRVCFLDVLEPSLGTALDALDGASVVVVPLLLSAGFHVSTDIPAVVAGRANVTVAGHLGPSEPVVDALVDRLGPVADDASVLLATVASSRDSARDEVGVAANLLGQRLGRRVEVLPLLGDVRARLADADGPIAVATYLLAPGLFSRQLIDAAAGLPVTVAEPLGTHPALVALVWSRYDSAVR